MNDLALPRFYVTATTGYGERHRRPATSYAVLDRLFCHREVYTDNVRPLGGGLPDFVRRIRAEAHPERANARHEQHMREVA